LARISGAIHLKRGVQVDLAARARPIVDREQRRSVFERLRPEKVEDWTEGSPLVEVEFS
jgi:hypothetical protein